MGLGQAWGPAGGKASWKEALVRHGAGRQAGLPPNVPPASIHRVRAAWWRGDRTRRRRPARPLPVPHGADPGTWLHSPGSSPNPQPCSSQGPLPAPGHYCFSAPTGGQQVGGWTTPCLATPSLGHGAWKAAPLSASHQKADFVRKQQRGGSHQHDTRARNSGRPRASGFTPHWGLCRLKPESLQQPGPGREVEYPKSESGHKGEAGGRGCRGRWGASGRGLKKNWKEGEEVGVGVGVGTQTKKAK